MAIFICSDLMAMHGACMVPLWGHFFLIIEETPTCPFCKTLGNCKKRAYLALPMPTTERAQKARVQISLTILGNFELFSSHDNCLK